MFKNLKEKSKGFIAGSVVTAMLVTSSAVFAAKGMKSLNAEFLDIKIMLDGSEFTPKDVTGKTVEPFIVDGTTYLPVRALSEAIGKDVQWDSDNATVIIGAQQSNVLYLDQISPIDKIILLTDGEEGTGGFYSTVDNSNYKRALKLESKYDNGHNTITLVYDLSSYDYETFETTIVSSDYKGKIEIIDQNNKVVYSTPEMNSSSKSIPVSLDISGMSKIKIRLTECDNSIFSSAVFYLTQAKFSK